MNFDSFVSGFERLRRLQPSAEPDDLLVVPRVDSTNRLARALAEGFERETESFPSLLLLALEQTGGRGRRGRSWSSPPGRGVYATRVVQTDEPARLQRLPQLVGLGLCAGVAAVADAAVRLKWPNDLAVEVEGKRRKLGGVLIESWNGSEGRTAACIGFGVNLSHASDELPEQGISLHALGHTAVDLPALAWSLTRSLESELRWLEGAEGAEGDDVGAEIVARYSAVSVHRLGEPMVCQIGEVEVAGTFQGFDEAGRLRLATEAGERVLAAGEVIER